MHHRLHRTWVSGLLAGVLVVGGGLRGRAQVASPASTEPLPSPLHISNWQVDGRLDVQLLHMEASVMTVDSLKLMSAELETSATIANAERDLIDVAVQWPALTAMDGPDGRGKEMHFGTAYAMYKFGLGKPNLRVGQFTVPFGNLTYYETHTRPLQTLYANSLGVRIDHGVSLEGPFQEYDYWLALMSGNGARQDNNTSPTIVGRVGRRLDLPHGTLLAGISALHGSDIPRFSPLVDPFMEEEMLINGMPMPAEVLTDKFRVGVDAEFSTGRDLWRAELIGGSDSDGSVNGQFLQWNRALLRDREVTAQAVRWEQPDGYRVRIGAALSQRLDQYATFRLALERISGHVAGDAHSETMLTFQYLREFPRLLGKK
jgi:hypothetical protein